MTGYRYVKVALSEIQWVNDELSISDPNFVGDSVAAYIVSADGSKMSNIFNLE